MKKTFGLFLLLVAVPVAALAGAVPGVPEISSGAAVSAIGLISGSLLILRGRRRR